MGCYTHPPGSLRRRGRRLPAGRPELVVSAPAFKQARQLTASDWNREEARVVAGFDAQQDRPFAAGPRIREGLAHLLRRGDALTCDVENYIAVLETLRGRRTVRIDLRDHHAVRACASHLARRSKREAELRNVGAVVITIAGRSAGFALLARQFAKRDVDGLLAALADDTELHIGAGRQARDALRQLAGVLHLLAVDAGDHVTGLDAGLNGRGVTLRLLPECALRLLQAEALGDVGIDRLNLHADPSTCHRALVLELGHDRLHRIGGNRERDADRAAGGRIDRRVHANHVAIDVESRTAGVALVHGRVDLDEIVIRTGADVPAARRHDAGRHGAAKAEGIADREHPVTDAWRLLAERNEREVAATLHLDQCD